MRHILKGFITSFIFAFLSALLLGAGKLIGINSLWWPIYWPSVIFALPGMPVIYMFDKLTIINKIFGLIFPEGGASGVFGAIVITAFIVWWVVFTILSKFNKLKHLTSGEEGGT